MPKPSIFSNNYDKSMKKRKRIKIGIIAVISIVVICIFIWRIVKN